ncbi:YgiQ family radical SAM protein [Plebeiibacterium marinum]|uniref:YgiQ family radical SAM protein n=1 Tax=Plebeiibacterium marinum TaxID=2992111 RepID=A0AAE3MH95_9BACT|nr:YgiQ family radical SAM protein [Plebeiobacterium marinum]MCW3807686.1 YgiQ family radical SAM protein [Plebeiobacterium marinum]
MENSYHISDWLPTTLKEVKQRGWEELDVIIFSGDAYIDHPSFGAAVIGRIIEREGLKVAIVPQPNWRDDLRDFKKLGTPRLFFGVTSGSMDSMVNHYTANKRLRSDDAYTPNGKAGFRPDYATETYCKILKELFPETPVVVGGIEASLRRVTHYDYWQNTLKPGILASSLADLLVYGMGEKPLKELLRLLTKGVPFNTIKTIPQTAYICNSKDLQSNKNWNDQTLFSHEECLKDKIKYAKNFRHIEEESNRWQAARLIQQYQEMSIVINPPYPPLSSKELDASFDLPYTRLPHPKYNKKGTIPAFEMIKFSVNMHRGCFGGCSFCTISAHQGKFIASRSEKSILKEVRQITQMPDFKGYISDLGGPSANMYQMKGKDTKICERCVRPSCIFPNICNNLNTDHTPMINLYKKINNMHDIKKAFIGSGVRYDMLYNKMSNDKEKESHKKYMEELIANHVSGRLKVAPEHTSDQVLKLMRKPSFSLFHKFKKDFEEINKKHNLNQQIIPYFISSHPGSKIEDMANLAVETKSIDFKLEQVQDLTPTPMTVSTVIFYSGVHPYTLEKLYTAKTKQEKLDQRIFFFWYKPEYKKQIERLLEQTNQQDLINKLFTKDKKQVSFTKKNHSKPQHKPHQKSSKRKK